MFHPHRRRFIAASLAALGAPAMITTRHAVAAEDAAPRKEWICPPCGCDDDDKVFFAPGRCPACDEELIEKPPSNSDTSKPRTP